jgi:hypothetical protein
MEDIRIGRHTTVNLKSVALSASRQEVFSRDARRIAVVFPPNETGAYLVHSEWTTGVGQGMPVSLATGPLILTLKDHGDLVRGAWSLSHGTTAATIYAHETLLTDDDIGKGK